MNHFPEKIYDMRGNNNGLYRVAVVRCNACDKEWGDGSWVTGMEGYEKAHAERIEQARILDYELRTGERDGL